MTEGHHDYKRIYEKYYQKCVLKIDSQRWNEFTFVLHMYCDKISRDSRNKIYFFRDIFGFCPQDFPCYLLSVDVLFFLFFFLAIQIKFFLVLLPTPNMTKSFSFILSFIFEFSLTFDSKQFFSGLLFETSPFSEWLIKVSLYEVPVSPRKFNRTKKGKFLKNIKIPPQRNL